MKNDSDYRLRHLQTIENIKQAQIESKSSSEIYQVPVVVHIMHTGEEIGVGSNISDADVRAGIQNLNNFWRKIEGTYGDGEGVDMQIEFALAIQDENGDCTPGINRVNMSLVDYEYVNNGVEWSSGGIGIPQNTLKESSRWDPEKYYNVWVVNKIEGENCDYNDGNYIGGYANYAESHGNLMMALLFLFQLFRRLRYNLGSRNGARI